MIYHANSISKRGSPLPIEGVIDHHKMVRCSVMEDCETPVLTSEVGDNIGGADPGLKLSSSP